jgi:hypothetical protein
METTELMVEEGVNRHRAGRLSRHHQLGESRRVRDDWIQWKWNALVRFARFPTINPVLSIAGELRRQLRQVVGFSMENRPTMTRRDGASELPLSNEWCKPTQCGTSRTPPAKGPAVAEFKYGSPSELQR